MGPVDSHERGRGMGRSREFDASAVPGLGHGNAVREDGGGGAGGMSTGERDRLIDDNTALRRRVQLLEVEVEEAVSMLEMYREQFGPLRTMDDD